ncbi:MAG: prolyl oligopeptidase family serine peptidase [Bacteroidota bacterium]
MRICLLSLCLGCFQLLAAQSKLTITVLDSTTQAPLPYASIYLEKAGIGQKTNSQGQAIFKLSPQQKSDSVIISYIGYHPQKLALTPETKALTVKLVSSVYLLEEVVIAYEKPLKPEQIVRKAIKNVKDNYSNKEVILRCLYRETVKEDEQYIQLNEAFADVFYTGYPHKRMDSKMWLDWFYDSEYAFDIEADRIYDEFFHEFNNPRDQMRLNYVRASENWSAYGVETGLMGGPLGLTSFDKVKYYYDFLDPKLVRKYQYKLAGKTQLHGAICYVIDFIPQELSRSFRSDQSKKTRDPIFTGKLYVETESFAVVKLEYDLALDRNYGFYTSRIPLAFGGEINYRQRNGRWYLSEIRATEKRTFHRPPLTQAIVHEGVKQMFVYQVEQGEVEPFPDSTIFKSTRYSAVRYYPQLYEADFWQDNTIYARYPLPPKVAGDLSQSKPLEKQFAERFQAKADLKPPILTPRVSYFEYPTESLADSFHWLAAPQNATELYQYLQAENQYAKNQLIVDRRYQKGIFDDLRTFYTKEEKNRSSKQTPGTYRYEEDSLGQMILYQYIDSVERNFCFNLSRFEQQKRKKILRILPNQSQTELMVYYLSPQDLGGYVAIVPKGDSIPIDSIQDIYMVEWWGDSALVYSQSNQKGGADNLYLHRLGEESEQLLWAEEDSTFDVEVYNYDKQVQINILSKSENEIHLLQGRPSQASLHLVKARQEGVEYSLRGQAGNWFMLSNAVSPNNQLYRSQDALPQNWQIIDPPLRKAYLADIALNERYIACKSYDKSYLRLHYRPLAFEEWTEVELPQKICEVDMALSQTKLDTLFLALSALNLAPRMLKVSLSTAGQAQTAPPKIKAPQWVHYAYTKRKWAKSADGSKVPMTILKSVNPLSDHLGCILKVYGAYGANSNPTFSAEDILLCHQGYTVVYAHVRGGGMMGYDWYRGGKLLNKKNSFADFIACAEYLIAKEYTDADHLVAYGNSAGGMIIGWAINERPELFNTAILDHPFVEVLHTTLNDSLPLTVDEYKEWGDPNDPEVYDYIKSYCPYQNIKPQAYPNLLYLAGIYDYQTPAWQIAKHVAAIRRQNRADSEILLITDMDSGHAGNMSTIENYKSFARMLSFLNINLFGEGP